MSAKSMARAARQRAAARGGGPAAAMTSPGVRVHGARTAYSSADHGAQSLAGWTPGLLSADAEWLFERDTSVARIRDLERNEGWVSSGIDRQVDMLVGATFRLNAKPDAEALGVSDEEAEAFGRRIQAAWRGWAEDPTLRCDVERQLPFAGIMALLAREFVGIGEGLAVLRWKPRAGWAHATAVHVIDADRLSNPMHRMDDDTFRGGVERDADGAPIAYHVRRAHPGDLWGLSADAYRWERIPRWDRIGDWERPKVLHVYDKRRPGQSRGVSRLVGALKKMRMLSHYSDAEVRAAAINASVVGAIYTQLGAEYAAEAIGVDGANADWQQFNGQRAEFYERSRGVMQDSRLLTLFPSDRMELNNQPRETAGYPAFQTSFLQAFAATLGVSYEQLSMDWSRTNYSSARAALNEVWRGVARLRGILIWAAAAPIYTAWLEEALDSGLVEPPAGAADFYDAPAAYTRAEWIGPGRGYIDPVKEAQAATLRMDARISTLEREAAEQGGDWEVNLAQIARERDEMERRVLAGPSTRDVGASREDERRADERPEND